MLSPSTERGRHSARVESGQRDPAINSASGQRDSAINSADNEFLTQLTSQWKYVLITLTIIGFIVAVLYLANEGYTSRIQKWEHCGGVQIEDDGKIFTCATRDPITRNIEICPHKACDDQCVPELCSKKRGQYMEQKDERHAKLQSEMTATNTKHVLRVLRLKRKHKEKVAEIKKKHESALETQLETIVNKGCDSEERINGFITKYHLKMTEIVGSQTYQKKVFPECQEGCKNQINHNDSHDDQHDFWLCFWKCVARVVMIERQELRDYAIVEGKASEELTKISMMRRFGNEASVTSQVNNIYNHSVFNQVLMMPTCTCPTGKEGARCRKACDDLVERFKRHCKCPVSNNTD
jgi:hypothetical protein